MKKIINLKTTILAFLLMAAGSTAAFAQCDKEATLTSSTTTHLDDKGTVLKTKEETAVITISKTDISIVPGDEAHRMMGKISSRTCDWKVPFKEGKTVVKAVVSGDGGDEKNITVTIIGTGGKVTLTFEADEMPGKKIQVVADKFE